VGGADVGRDGHGLLLKGLIAVVFPVGAGLSYLYFTGLLARRKTWARLSR